MMFSEYAIRWRNCLYECEKHGLLGVRLPAVDAKKTRYSRLSSGTYSDASKELDSLLSPDIVTRTWDSTLNATFDRNTVVSKVLAMTPSERACAVSHVLAWKLIYLTSLRYGDGSIKLLTRDCEARLAKTPPLCLSSPRSNSSDASSAKVDDRDIANFSIFCKCSQWVNVNGFYLVLEDDMEIKASSSSDTREFMEKLSDLCQHLPADTDICYLGYIIPTGCIAKHGRRYIKPKYLWQLHAYLLSPSGAKKLLSHLPVNAPVDNFVATLIHEEKITVTNIRSIDMHFVIHSVLLQAYALPMKSRLVKQAAGGIKSRRTDSDIVHSGRLSFE